MITVIGSINLDLIATVERLPAPGETVPGDGFKHGAGRQGRQPGAGRRARRRQGAHDRRGRQGRLRRPRRPRCLPRAASTSPASAKRMQPTGVALILVGADGENVIAVVPGANDTVLPRRPRRGGDFAKGEVVLLQHEMPLAHGRGGAGCRARRPARSACSTPRPSAARQPAACQGRLCRRQRNRVRPLCRSAAACAARDRLARMRAFAEQHRPHDHRHAGRRRRHRRHARRRSAGPALKITPVDTVGAGDTFCGYLAAGLAAGLPLEQALRRAAAAGSLACLKPGAQPAIPTAEGGRRTRWQGRTDRTPGQ